MLHQNSSPVKRDFAGRFSTEAALLAQRERRDAYLDSCREADGDILFLAPPLQHRKLAKAIEQAEAVAKPTVFRFSEQSFVEATKRDRQRAVNWPAV